MQKCKKQTCKSEFKISAISANEKVVALYDRCESHMRFVANVPDSRYTDWFHNLLASGGMLQYQINQLLYALGKLGISCESVDQFACVLPRSHTKLKKNIFRGPLCETHQEGPSGVWF